MLSRQINNRTLTLATEDGSQTAEIRAIQANMYMQREFVHGLPLRVANDLYSHVIDIIHDDKQKNEAKLQGVSVLIHNLQVRIANQLNYDNLLGLACIYFYIDGEDPLNYTGSHDAEKLALMKSNKDDMLFFCTKACEYTPSLKVTLDIDLADYLKTIQELIDSQSMNIHKQ